MCDELSRLREEICTKEQELRDLEFQEKAIITYFDTIDKKPPRQKVTYREIIKRLLEENSEGIRRCALVNKMRDMGLSERVIKSNLGSALSEFKRTGYVTQENREYRIA